MLVSQNIHIIIFPPFVYKLLPIFHTKICIRYLKKRSHESFSLTTFNVVVVGVKGYYKSANNEGFRQVLIIDGITEEDHDIFRFSRLFHDQYVSIKDTFENDEIVLEIFKNITIISKYDEFFKIDTFTIVTQIMKEEECQRLLNTY